MFVATSDEALPIMLGAAATDPSVWGRLGLLIGIKVVMALAAGYLINFLTRRRELTQTPYREEDMPHEHGCCGHSLEHDHAHGADHDAEDGEEHVETRGEKAKRIFVTYFKHPLIHTAVITLFIFIVNLILGGIMHFAEDAAREFMQGSIWLQPLLADARGADTQLRCQRGHNPAVRQRRAHAGRGRGGSGGQRQAGAGGAVQGKQKQTGRSRDNGRAGALRPCRGIRAYAHRFRLAVAYYYPRT